MNWTQTRKLKEELKNLALCRNDITGTEYLSRILSLFGNEGLELTLKELDMLLLLRIQNQPDFTGKSKQR